MKKTLMILIVIAAVLSIVVWKASKDSRTPVSEVKPSAQQAATSSEAAVGDDDPAIATTTVYLSSCVPTPAKIKFKAGSLVTFVNGDAKQHSVYLDDEHFLVIGTSSSRSIQMAGTAGSFSYGCDAPTPVGYAEMISE